MTRSGTPSSGQKDSRSQRAATLAFVTSGALCLGLFLAYWLQPDALGALLVLPAWLWLVPGLAIAVLPRRRSGVWVALLWVAFLLWSADSPMALVRGPGGSAPELPRPAGVLRVIALNCSGSAAAVAALATLQPDVVLLQELPRRAEVERLTRDLFGERGSFIWSFDTSILARGRLESDQAVAGPHPARRARLTRDSGEPIELLSVRLLPAESRLDLLRPRCWSAYRANREQRRDELAQVTGLIDTIPGTVPLIVGGDTNAPARDRLFDVLSPRLRDSFEESGRGWGNTVLGDRPFHRIDRIFMDDHLACRFATTWPLTGTDHRAVVADIVARQ